ncbi:Aminoglycoside phosphotransferase [Pseudonocardia sp. Ae168_Ps1]|uniref:aminoglycoside phosphotransferase family protein n=1 Tax=unclassified Pseudonocardia TaxID=2619320 RepID=UPI00094B7251|nr:MULTISPECIES: aminoglycoside phosphotransferase family protein [unclassified Pseudonocardia]OLL71058.1 Aminoglycoside phosphotransferase [Pseudonocardia sp. Ae168_Ps1]OLL77391.1 Aminoglycoside phosphotransferase [Pseudonocardia sp. Ae150A_Ps1]OLL88497.1 Aminoglycoside phosphotransferase [Pseudonocardia sp. Ae263_Ps1]OLL91480.1 Aminoglycoside phosphotransferase [Pseudonocardia sp. Ae356_Ps1]
MLRDEIDAALATRLIEEQFPQWTHLPVVEVDERGWDNRTFRLGTELTIRLPSAERYAAAVAKELTWLPWLATTLPVPIPVPIAEGRPSSDYPRPWSIRRWIPGRTASATDVGTSTRFAEDLARFLRALQRVDASTGPPAGPHSFFRGADVAVYDDEARRAIAALGYRIATDDALAVWDHACESRWTGDQTWFHGDVASGNLLVERGRLSAVIDFGTCGVGDPACDLVPTWTLFWGEAREIFCVTVDASEETWARARGWALWKAAITAATDGEIGPTCEPLQTISAVIKDHYRGRTERSSPP